MSCRSWALSAEGGGDMVSGCRVLLTAPRRGGFEKFGDVHGGVGMKTAAAPRERGLRGVGSGVLVSW